MWYLILQILLLLLLAALLGGLFVYWWLKNRYEEVAETSVAGSSQASFDATGLLTLDEFRAGLADVRGPDLSPLSARLDSLERSVSQARGPDLDLGPLNRRMESLEQMMSRFTAPEIDLDPIGRRLDDIEGALLSPNNDLDSLHARLGALEERIDDLKGSVSVAGAPDVEPMRREIAALSASVSQQRQLDLTPLASRLDSLEQRLSTLRAGDADIDPLLDAIAKLEERIDAIAVPETDLGGVYAGLDRLEQSINAAAGGDTDLTPVLSGLTRVEQRIAGLRLPEPDLAALQTGLSRVEQSLAGLTPPESDLAPLRSDIARVYQAVTSVSIPEPDLGPLHSGLIRLEQSVSDLKSRETGADLDRVTGSLAMLERRLADLGDRLEAGRRTDVDRINASLGGLASQLSGLSLPEADLGPVIQRVDMLRAQLSQPDKDLEAVSGRLLGLEGMIAGLDREPVNLRPVEDRIASVERSVLSVLAEIRRQPGMEPLERRVSALQDALRERQEPDMGPILQSMRAIDSRLDLGAVENRLTAIEYGLAAVHHMLRSRPPESGARLELETRRVSTATPARNGGGETETEKDLVSGPTLRRPQRGADPIDSVRRRGDQANLIKEPAFGPPDDLKQINGVGAMLSELLNEIGVYYYWQVAEWTPEEVDWVDGLLMHFKGRIERDNWVDQARTLAAQPGAAARPQGLRSN